VSNAYYERMTRDPFDSDPFADGFVEEPPAPEPKSTIAHEDQPPRPSRLRRASLQLAHRMAVLAFLALVTGIGLALYRRAEYWHLLLVAFIAADLTLLLALIGSWLRPSGAAGERRREPLVLIVFSVAMLIPTILLVWLAKSDRLSGWIDWTWERGGQVEIWAEQRLGEAAERPALPSNQPAP
jgi:hypothetical protein